MVRDVKHRTQYLILQLVLLFLVQQVKTLSVRRQRDLLKKRNGKTRSTRGEAYFHSCHPGPIPRERVSSTKRSSWLNL
jgi:hypothetical protein